MESATATNTGHKGLDYEVALAMAKGRAGQALVELLQNRAQTTPPVLSGTVVAPGGNLASATLTPKFSGKVKVSWFGSWQAPGAGVVTPQLRASQGGPFGQIVAISQSGTTEESVGGSLEVDGLLIGTPYTVRLQTTAGDASITLGQGLTGVAANVLLEEVP